MTEYNFANQLQIEDKYTPLVLKYLENSSGQKPVDVRNQCLEYDFLLGTQKLDLKADTLMSSTSNFFLETASVVKKGWLYNQNVDSILYLDVKNLRLHILNLKELQKHEQEITHWPRRTIIQDKNYMTMGHCVPITKVAQWLKFKTVNLNSIQLADILEGKI